MKLKSINTAAEIDAAIRAPRGDRPLIEVTMEDKTLKGVRIGTAHFRQESYSTFKAMAEVNQEEAERYRLTAKIKGFPDQVSYHDDSAAAYRAAEKFGDAVETDVEGPISVFIDAGGKIVGEVNATKPVTEDDLPF